MTDHKIHSVNAFPIGIVSFVLAALSAAYATAGHFDTRVKYCDARSNPCTEVVTVPQDAAPPRMRENQEFLQGNGILKTTAALGSFLASTIAIVSCSIALRQREEMDEENTVADTEKRNKAEIQSDLRTQIAAIEAQAQLDLHRKLTYDATADLYLDESPELVEDIAQMQIEAKQREQEESSLLKQRMIESQQQAAENGITPSTVVPATPENREHYLQVGDRTLDKLGTLTQSTILISSPGSGKTTTICAAWGRMKKRLGKDFHATVIVYKAKDKPAFKGIADEVICFPESPDDAVIAILRFVEAMKLGGSLKAGRLFVDDFLTIWGEIEALYKGKYITNDYEFTHKKAEGKAAVTDWLISQMNAVFLVGRESNNALWISSHSPNVEDLPFVASKGARVSGNLLFLARQDPENGNGNYEVVQQNIGNHHLVSDDQKRKELNANLPGLIELSQQSGEPIILTSHGVSGGWEIGLVGKDIRQEYEQYRQQWTTPPLQNQLPETPQPPKQPSKGEAMKIKLKELVEAGATLAEIMHELWNVTSEDDQRFKLGLEFVQKMAQEMGLELPPQAPQRQLSDKARALLERLKERFPADCTRFSVREVNRAFSSFNGQKINADDLRAIMQEIIDIAGTGELDGNTFVYPL